MKIIIVGAGQVGFHMASRLVGEGHDVVVIDRDEQILAHTTENLDIQGLRGHGARPKVLREAGIAQAQMIVAVTGADEVNMVACQMAAILGPPDIIKIARVREPDYLEAKIFEDARVCIDLAINPEQQAADRLLSVLRYPAITEALDFAHGKLRLLALRVQETSPLSGMRFLDLPERFTERRLLIAALRREDRVIIPRGPDVILPADEVYLVAEAGEVDALLRMVGVPPVPIARVMLAGGSKINRFVARELERRGVRPKLIEPDGRLARWLADELPQTMVLAGSPTDADLLRGENIQEMQSFVAASTDEESNVMAALLARRLGARRVIATTNRVDYLPLMRHIGIDVCISPWLLAVNAILRYLRQGHVVAARSLGEGEHAEVLEFEAHEGAAILGQPLHSLRLPAGVLVAAILRGGEPIVPQGSSVIQAEDHVIFVALRRAIPAVERLMMREGRPEERPVRPKDRPEAAP